MRTMNFSVVCAAVIGVVVASLSGCATAPAQEVSAVGPAGPVTDHTATGKLIVYSATIVETAEQSRYALHSDYELYDEKGTPLRNVENHAGLFAADPVTLTLAAGQYRVKALATSAGHVVVPVVVAPGRTTTVYLDDTPVPVDLRNSGNEVRLPDGHVVGWRAK
jgi:hypothetical protein